MKHTLLFSSLALAMCLLGIRLAHAGNHTVPIDHLALVSETVPASPGVTPEYRYGYGRYGYGRYGYGRYYGRYEGRYYGRYSSYYPYYGRYYGRYYGYYPYYSYGWNSGHRTPDSLPQPRVNR